MECWLSLCDETNLTATTYCHAHPCAGDVAQPTTMVTDFILTVELVCFGARLLRLGWLHAGVENAPHSMKRSVALRARSVQVSLVMFVEPSPVRATFNGGANIVQMTPTAHDDVHHTGSLLVQG